MQSCYIIDRLAERVKKRPSAQKRHLELAKNHFLGLAKACALARACLYLLMLARKSSGKNS
jgi:hypothetical protein